MAVQVTQSAEFAKLFDLQQYREGKKGLKQTNPALFTDCMRGMIGDAMQVTKSEAGIMALGRYVIECGSKEQHKQLKETIRPIILKRLQECKNLDEAEFYKKYVDTFCPEQKSNYKKLVKSLKETAKAEKAAEKATNAAKEAEAAKKAEEARKAVEDAKQKLSIKYDRGAGARSLAFNGPEISSEARAADLAVAFGAKTENVPQISSYTDATKAAEEARKAEAAAEEAAKEALTKTMEHKLNINPLKVGIGETIPPQPPFRSGIWEPDPVEKLSETIRQQREASFNSPASQAAREFMNPSIPERLIPEVEPKELGIKDIYDIGVEDGMKKGGKKVINNNTYKTIINDISIEVTDNVTNNVTNNIKKVIDQNNQNLQKNFNTFTTNVNQRLNQFENAQNTFLTGMDSKLQQFTDAQNDAIGKMNDATKKIEKSAQKIDDAATRIGQSADRMDKVADRIEQASQKAEQTLNQANHVLGETKKTQAQIGKTLNEVNQGVKKMGSLADQASEMFTKASEALKQAEEARNATKGLKGKYAGLGFLAGAVAVALGSLLNNCSGDKNQPATAPIVAGAGGDGGEAPELEFVGDPEFVKPPVLPIDTTKIDTTGIGKLPSDSTSTDSIPSIVPPVATDSIGNDSIGNDSISTDSINGRQNQPVSGNKPKKYIASPHGTGIEKMVREHFVKDYPEVYESLANYYKEKTGKDANEETIIRAIAKDICEKNSVDYDKKPQNKPQYLSMVEVESFDIENAKKYLFE